MKQIEIPSTTYWQAKTGRRFSNKQDCERYELLHDKWVDTRKEFQDIEGQQCFAYWIETTEDLEEVLWFAKYAHYASVHNYIGKLTNFTPMWIILYPDYDEYGAETAVKSLEDYKEVVEDTMKAAQSTLLYLNSLSSGGHNA